MQEIMEFRIPEENAKEYLRPTDGVCLHGSVRKVVLLASDPLVAKISSIQTEFRAKGKFFFLGWNVRRRYTNSELQSAEAFRLLIKHTFEPPGEVCGTVYDESGACEYCGSGGLQSSDLILEARSLPKRSNLGIAKTIAGEMVVSQSFVEVFQANKLKGAEFRPVKQRKNPALAVPGWHQLFVTSRPLTIVAPTQTGDGLFGDDTEPFPTHLLPTIPEEWKIHNPSWCDREGEYRCPLGHTIGLNLLSELSVDKSGFQECDIAFTKQRVGVRRGLLRPEPLLVISPRLRETLLREGLKGMAFEVAHLVASERL